MKDSFLSAQYAEIGDTYLAIVEDRVYFSRRQADRWRQIADLEEEEQRRKSRQEYRRTPSGMLRTVTPNEADTTVEGHNNRLTRRVDVREVRELAEKTRDPR